MHQPKQPTVRQLPPIRRLLAGALVAGAVAAAVPAAASAASTCTYDPTFKRVTVEASDGNSARLVRVGPFIGVSDGGTARLCGPTVFATVNNTDKILVNTPGPFFAGENPSIVVDQSQGAFAPGATPENDGNSEIEVQVRLTRNRVMGLGVVGTPQDDAIRLGGQSSVMLGPDADVDVSMISLSSLQPVPALPFGASGGDGNDFITARGHPASLPQPAINKVQLIGGPGSDDLIDGGSGLDTLHGQTGNDRLFAADGRNGDAVSGGPDFDVATLDAGDTFTSDVEQNSGGVLVGRLRLAPAIVRAQPGEVARMTMSWTHPKAWKALRSVEWRVYHGADALGTITVSPRSGGLNARGDVKLVRDGSRVSHEGKTVTAKLAVRLPKSLAGEELRVDVQATDMKGRTQLEPSAGLIRVAQ